MGRFSGAGLRADRADAVDPEIGRLGVDGVPAMSEPVDGPGSPPHP